MCHQPPGTDVCNTFKSSLMRGHFKEVAKPKKENLPSRTKLFKWQPLLWISHHGEGQGSQGDLSFQTSPSLVCHPIGYLHIGAYTCLCYVLFVEFTQHFMTFFGLLNNRLFNGSTYDVAVIIFSMFETWGECCNNYFWMFHKFILDVSIVDLPC